MIGRTVGNYVVKEIIGKGGMGAVYLAEHPRIHRTVAIKVLLPEYSKDPQVVARFFNEAKASSEIRNDHIIEILDFGELPDEGGSYIAMEFLDGTSLAAALAQAGSFRLARAVHITRGVGRALAAAHARGIVHRDLKPDNIFLIRRGDDTDFVKVLDFGIAKLTTSNAAGPDVKTKTGSLIGTPAYMSPEQCKGALVDHRTDIYALGVVLYQMLTGTLPFTAEGLGELLLQHMTMAPRPLRELKPEIPIAVERAVLRALEKDALQRFQTVEELLNGLQEVATGPHVAFDPPGGSAKTAPRMDTLGRAAVEVAPTLPPRPRSRILTAAAAGALVVTAAAIGFVKWHGGETHPATPGPLAHVGGETAGPGATAPGATSPGAAATTGPGAANSGTTAGTSARGPGDAAHVRIRVTPPSAELRLDDAALTNPFDGEFPRSPLKHRLAVTAPGFHSHAEWVTFEADREIAVALAPRSGPRPRDPARAGGTPPAGKIDGKSNADTKTIYKGTKGTLITDYPDH